MLTSSEEQLASMSQGLDITVESSEIHQYDYVEDIRQKKWLIMFIILLLIRDCLAECHVKIPEAKIFVTPDETIKLNL